MKKLLIPVYDKRFGENMMEYIKIYGVDLGYEITLLHVTAQPNYYEGEGVLSDSRYSDINYSDIIPHVPTKNFTDSQELYNRMSDEILDSCIAQIKTLGIINVSKDSFKGDAASKMPKMVNLI